MCPEKPGYNKLIFQVLKMSWNFTKIRKCPGNVLEKILPLKNNSLRTKKPMNKYYNCRKMLQL